MVDNLSAINGQIRVGSKGNTIILVVTLLMLMRQVWHIQGFSSIVGHYNQFRVMAVVNTKGCFNWVEVAHVTVRWGTFVACSVNNGSALTN